MATPIRRELRAGDHPGLRPIGYNVWVSEGAARPGYVYTLDGQDYTADEAAQLVSAGNEDRWGWRPVDDADEP